MKRVVAALEAAGVDYMFTGSVASSLQGEPRSTHDLDLVVELEPASISKLVSAFPPSDFYLDEQAVQTAMAGTGEFRQFNLIELTDGNKVDFWLLSSNPFDRERFSRKQVIGYSGLRLKVSRPEDTILMKLRWAKMSGGSEKQFGDARGVYELQYPRLDQPYMEQWVAQLGVTDLWERLKRDTQTGDEQGWDEPGLRPR